jgi:deoxyribose-phosphate aldolase
MILFLGKVRKRGVMRGDTKITQPEDVCPFIEQTLLAAVTTKHQIVSLCEEAKNYKFRGVCVLPTNIVAARLCLENSSVKIITVVGFPLGGNTSKAKCFEAIECIDLGADEIDMVINVGALKGGEHQYVQNDIAYVVKSAKNIPVKVIIETGLLTHEEKTIACKLSLDAGAQFVKTCTGFAAGGATVEDIQLIRQVVGTKMKIKASGGIRSYADAKTLIEAGADTLGTSRGVEIASGKSAEGGGY